MRRGVLSGRRGDHRMRLDTRALAAAAPLLVVATLALGGGAHADPTVYRDEVLADTPVSFWRLSETSGTTIVDDRGLNNGQYSSSGVTLGQPGAVVNEPANLAAAFDGTTGAGSVPAAPSLDMTAGVTAESWVKRSKSGWQVVVAK